MMQPHADETDRGDRLTTLFRVAREIVATTDPRGYIVALNPRWAAGPAAEAQRIHDLVEPADAAAVDAGLAAAFEDGGAWTARNARTGLGERWRATPAGPDLLFVASEPASPDPHAAQAIAEGAGIGLTLIDVDGRYRYVNDAYCRTYGYPREELIGELFTRVFDPGDHDQALAFHRSVLAGGRQGELRELRVERRDGSSMLIETWSQRIDLPDGRCYRLATVLDVTERRSSEMRLAEAEARLRDIHDRMPGAVYQLKRYPDGSYETTHMSEGFRELTGLPADRELADLDTILGMLPESDARRAIELAEASARDMTVYHQLFALDGPAGRRWIDARSQPHVAADGTVVWNGVMIDITDQRDAQAEAQRLSAILESTPDCVAVTDTDGGIRYLNAGGYRLLGLAPEAEVLGRRFLDFVAPDDAQRTREEALPAATAHGTWAGEVTIVGAGGHEVSVSQTILCHRDAAGAVTHFSTIIRDLSERAAAERELAASEERFRQLYNRTPVMLHEIDTEGRITAVSDYWLEHLGYTREEVLGRSSLDFFTEASQRRAREVERPRFWSEGRLKNVPFQVVRRDGTVLDVLLSADSDRDDGGNVVRGRSVMIDVSEQRRAEASYQDLYENATEGIYRSTPNGRLLRANPALVAMQGFDTEDELLAAVQDIGTDWYVDPTTRRRLIEHVERDGRVENFEAEIQCCGRGGRIRTSENVRAVHGPDGAILYYEGTVRDITAQYRAQQLARHRGEILEMIARDHDLTGTLYEIVGAVEQASTRVTAAIFRLQEDRLLAAAAPGLANDCIRAVDRAAPGDIGGVLEQALARGAGVVTDTLDASTSGFARAARESGYGVVVAVPLRDQRGEPLGVLAAFARDATAAGDDVAQLLREMAQIASIAIEQFRLAQQLVRQAQYDTLTDLPNRALLSDRLEQAVGDAKRGGHGVAVLLLDLDEFKLVNDTLGHSAGDDLLQKVAERLQGCLRAGDTVARLGGDEFVLVVPLRGGGDPTDIAERVLGSLQKSVLVAEREVTARPSIGIGLYPQDGTTSETLLQAADTAMYAAKHAGKNRFRYFAEDMNQDMSARLRIEAELRNALDRDQLALHYQPRVSLTDGGIVGAEALLRWYHPERGVLGPGEFLAVAERGPMIAEIDRRVLESAAKQAARWQHAGERLVVSANLSTRELHTDGFAADAARMIADAAVDPAGLELEITESMLMHDFERATRQLRDLKRRAPGLRIAIDDFGSGYSSLNYLRHLPIDTLKIDRSFVADLVAADPGSAAAIVKTIIELGHNLGLTVVAEGVERGDQAGQLKGFGCHEAQGFYYAAAVPVDRFDALLAEAAALPAILLDT